MTQNIFNVQMSDVGMTCRCRDDSTLFNFQLLTFTTLEHVGFWTCQIGTYVDTRMWPSSRLEQWYHFWPDRPMGNLRVDFRKNFTFSGNLFTFRHFVSIFLETFIPLDLPLLTLPWIWLISIIIRTRFWIRSGFSFNLSGDIPLLFLDYSWNFI